MDESDFDEFLFLICLRFYFLLDARSIVVPENVYVCLLVSEGGRGGKGLPGRELPLLLPIAYA